MIKKTVETKTKLSASGKLLNMNNGRLSVEDLKEGTVSSITFEELFGEFIGKEFKLNVTETEKDETDLD